ncbi:DUF3737 family protein [Paenibacillus sp. FSL H7-0357]|uniref:DUF3737 family protein n=1 Tax=unclassified Paenibacillus TaxID=185978 RepID=UPI0009DCF637|nr:DUF3737 family protein [Paenibacillus sp. FSL H7-0357]
MVYIFRRASYIHLTNVALSNALETLWNCKDVNLKHVSARGDYFGMNSEGVQKEWILFCTGVV